MDHKQTAKSSPKKSKFGAFKAFLPLKAFPRMFSALCLLMNPGKQMSA